jgi:catalase
MHGYSGHTFKFTKTDGSFSYVQIHVKTDQGIQNLTNDEAAKLSMTDPDSNTRDLFNAIKRGEYPTWTVYIQVLDPKDVANFRWNIFDLTKVWPQKDIPLRPVGKIILNRNVSRTHEYPFWTHANLTQPENYFAEIEQVAFSPGHLIPGIEASADPVLQGRLFSYADSQRHRLGVNYQQIPVNLPLHPNNPFQRDGYMTVNGNSGLKPNYPSTFEPLPKPQVYAPTQEQWTGQATTFQFEVTDEDFVQATSLWEVLGRQPGQQGNFVHNVASHLNAAEKTVRQRAYAMFSRVDKVLGERIQTATEKAASD